VLAFFAGANYNHPRAAWRRFSSLGCSASGFPRHFTLMVNVPALDKLRKWTA
jgi:hypothetical protein